MREVIVNSIKITNCMDCPHHKVEPDPDFDDWFCRDDIKVRCTRSSATYRGNHGKEPYVTVACRPYNDRKESDIPHWCPLLQALKAA